MRDGFSLVELSIVLVILGLLTGGILAGQSLIHGAELRKLSTEVSKYQSAYAAFRDKYFYWPGDINNATSFWGRTSVAGICDAHPGTVSATGTCNGDGNGSIGNNGGLDTERPRAWQHLALAGLIEGSFTPVGTDGLINQTVGLTIPESAIKGSGYLADFVTTGQKYIRLGSLSGPNSQIKGPVLKPEDSWNIDTKRDDGIAAKGKVLGYNAQDMAGATYSTVCLNATTLTYDLAVTGVACRHYFELF